MQRASLFFLISCLLLLSFIVDAEAKKNPTKFDKFQKKRRDECMQTACIHLPKDLNDNCINQCMSPLCFDKLYADGPPRRWRVRR